jgi:hypothetical protein
MIYGVSRNNGQGIGYSHFSNCEKSKLSAQISKTPSNLYSSFVKKKTEDLNVSNAEEISESGTLSKSESQTAFEKGKSVDLNISRADIRTSEPQVKDSEALSSSEPLISKLKVQGKSQSKMTQGIALKISGPMLMRGVKTSEAPL